MLLEALRAAAPGRRRARRRAAHDCLWRPACRCSSDEIDWLRASGAERHALLADNGVPWALADLALHVGEMLSVPLPGSFTPRSRCHALDDAGIDALLTDDATRVAPVAAGLASRRHVARLGPAAVPPAARPGDPGRRAAQARARSPTPRAARRTRRACASRARRSRPSRSRWLERRANLPIARHLCILPLATLLENVAGSVCAPAARARRASCRRARSRA